MTSDNPAPDNQPTGIRLGSFIIVAVVVIIGAFAAVWFAIPGPDTQHRLVSPSGTRVIELAELCSPNGCSRVAILDQIRADGTHLRTGCPLAISGPDPLFDEIASNWSSSEESVTVDYASDSGSTGSLTIDTALCTQTE
jgi:hypothetical protein